MQNEGKSNVTLTLPPEVTSKQNQPRFCTMFPYEPLTWPYQNGKRQANHSHFATQSLMSLAALSQNTSLVLGIMSYDLGVYTAQTHLLLMGIKR